MKVGLERSFLQSYLFRRAGVAGCQAVWLSRGAGPVPAGPAPWAGRQTGQPGTTTSFRLTNWRGPSPVHHLFRPVVLPRLPPQPRLDRKAEDGQRHRSGESNLHIGCGHGPPPLPPDRIGPGRRRPGAGQRPGRDAAAGRREIRCSVVCRTGTSLAVSRALPLACTDQLLITHRARPRSGGCHGPRPCSKPYGHRALHGARESTAAPARIAEAAASHLHRSQFTYDCADTLAILLDARSDCSHTPRVLGSRSDTTHSSNP